MLKRMCCRCLSVLSTGHAEDAPVTHTFCLSCLPDIYPFEVESVRDMTTEMLDALPYGVVRLDADNRVVEYSRAEAVLARREPAEVIGHNFFKVVAPCTNVQSLAGWVAATASAGRSDQTRLDFVFDFPHGRQFVKIAMVYDSAACMTTITVDVIEEQLASP